MIAPSWIKKTILLILPVPVFAGSIEAFTISSNPFTNLVAGVTPCYVDQAEVLMSQVISDVQGSTPQTIKSKINKTDMQALSNVMTCSYQAALLGVQKVPAVVVDNQYVVYGNTDMTGAVAEIQNAQTE